MVWLNLTRCERVRCVGTDNDSFRLPERRKGKNMEDRKKFFSIDIDEKLSLFVCISTFALLFACRLLSIVLSTSLLLPCDSLCWWCHLESCLRILSQKLGSEFHDRIEHG